MALSNLATVLERKGDDKGAERLYRRALRLQPGNAETHRNLGTLLLMKKFDLEGAERCFQQALQLDPACVAAYRNLSCVLFEKGDLEGAERETRAALRLGDAGAEAMLKDIQLRRMLKNALLSGAFPRS